MKKDDRFEKIYSQGALNGMEIWRDRVTGVQYLYCFSGYAGGLTALLDADGRPVTGAADAAAGTKSAAD